MDTIQTHPRNVPPSLFVIPKLDAFEDAIFTGQVHNIVFSLGRNPATHHELLGSAITEVNDQAIKEDRVTTDPQLNRMKKPVTTSDLNLSMILTPVYLGIAQ